jgi:hypothetical protein
MLRSMKISPGVFPWQLLYLGLLIALLALLAYWCLNGDVSGRLGPELPLCFSLFAAWWSFLTFKSGVAPSRFGNQHLRASSPIAFWIEVIFLVGLGLLFAVMAIFW